MVCLLQICKHFLEAVESSKYGWFWECPGGEKCHYRHALPAGYVLSKDKKKMEEQKVRHDKVKRGETITNYMYIACFTYHTVYSYLKSG